MFHILKSSTALQLFFESFWYPDELYIYFLFTLLYRKRVKNQKCCLNLFQFSGWYSENFSYCFQNNLVVLWCITETLCWEIFSLWCWKMSCRFRIFTWQRIIIFHWLVYQNPADSCDTCESSWCQMLGSQHQPWSTILIPLLLYAQNYHACTN